jgi:hypothetical protein
MRTKKTGTRAAAKAPTIGARLALAASQARPKQRLRERACPTPVVWIGEDSEHLAALEGDDVGAAEEGEENEDGVLFGVAAGSGEQERDRSHDRGAVWQRLLEVETGTGKS